MKIHGTNLEFIRKAHENRETHEYRWKSWENIEKQENSSKTNMWKSLENNEKQENSLEQTHDNTWKSLRNT